MLLIVAGCAAPVPPPPPVETAPAPIAYPAATRERMMAIVLAEWREWGANVIDARNGMPVNPAVPLAEEEPAAFSKVLAYWSAVDEQDYIARNKRAFIAGSAAGLCGPGELGADGRAAIWGCEPWSAAFISYVMRNAGIDRAEFPPAIGHRTYVDAMIANSDRWGTEATFVAHEVADYAPVAGDLICADRAGRGAITTLAERRRETGASRPMHCDVVVRVAPGEVLAVGGNVADAVTGVRYRTDASGHLVRNARRWFGVFENRIGVRG